MASALYPLGKQAILNKEIDFDSDTIKVKAVSSSDYTYSAAHQYASSVTSYSGTTDAALVSPSITLGVFDAADFTPFATALAIDGAKTITAWVLYRDTGTPTTSPLIAFIDVATAPITPNGTDINLIWDNGANKIFRI